MKAKIKEKKSAAAQKFVYHHIYYDLVFHVCLDFYAGDREEIKKMIFKKYFYKTRDNCNGESVEMVNTKANTTTNVIWIGDLSNFYTLSHELVHLTKSVFEARKIPFTCRNDETIAYYHTYWFRKLWHDIGEYDKKFKKLNEL